MAKARQQYFADEVTLQKENRDFAIQPELVEKLESIEAGAQVNVIETVKVNGEALIPDEDKAVDVSVPLVEDTLYSTDTDKALSANQGKVLYDYIQNLASRGRYLSNWNAVTGLPTSNPVDNPYQYRAGDYYVVSNVAALGGTNYRPNGSSYSWNVASTIVETEIVKVGDYYTYDGQVWLLLVNTAREIAVDSSLSTISTNPVENRVITNALNTKQDIISDLQTIREGAALGATALQPGDSLSELTGTSDDITEGSTNLFMTTSERTKLSNQSGVNTGDETQTTIKNKLGQASTSTDGYLTSTDWNTFNNKQDAINDLSTIRSNAQAGKNASDIIATYGDIVTHDADEFATAESGAKADTALQPGDNISELTNDAGYVTDAYHDSTKQDKLIAGTNIQIAADGKTISATDTTYQPTDFDIKDLSDSTGLRTSWSGKQDKLIAGTNIQIAQDGKTISATDTTYSAGPGIAISQNNVISCTQASAEWGNITGNLSDQTDLQDALDEKQDKFYTQSEYHPENPSEGDVYYNVDDRFLDIYSGGEWHTLPMDTGIGLVMDQYGVIDIDRSIVFNKATNTSDNIIEGNTHKFVTPAEKNTWNGKQNQFYTTLHDAHPSNPNAGDMNYDIQYETLEVYNGNEWVGVKDNDALRYLGIHSDAPLDAEVGDIYHNDIDGKDYVYTFHDGWIEYTKRFTNMGDFESDADVGDVIYDSYDGAAIISRGHNNTPAQISGHLGSLWEEPDDAFPGDTYKNQVDGKLYIYDNYEWIPIEEASAYTWGNITGDIADQLDLMDELSYKANIDSVLTLDNTTPYSPYDEYNPATKGYVDENDTVVSATEPTGSDAYEGRLWYDTANNILKSYNGTSWEATGTQMVILKYGTSTWQDFIAAYRSNAIVYCRASSNTNPATGSQTRLAFMAYVSDETNPTSVEFQYYRSRSDHNSQANELDEVYVYKLQSNGAWSVTVRNTAAKTVAGTGISLGWGNGNVTINNTGVTSINSKTGAVSISGGTGINIDSNNEISVDTTTIATKSDIANFAGFKVVATLPTTDIKTNIIYLLGPVGTGQDKYEEYIYSNNAWIKIGDTSIDLSPYFHMTNNDSDDIIQGSTNLFLTSTERTKLSNTSGTNTGDETKATIQSKLGAATSSNDGYLTSADWSTFNAKADSGDIQFRYIILRSLSDTDTLASLVASPQYTMVLYNREVYGYESSTVNSSSQIVTTYASIDTFESIGTSNSTLYKKTIVITMGNTPTATTGTLNISNFLSTSATYTTPYAPTQSYNPATKKYVDDAIISAGDIKVFSLYGTGDTTNAQAAVDWYLAGKFPVLFVESNEYYYLDSMVPLDATSPTLTFSNQNYEDFKYIIIDVYQGEVMNVDSSTQEFVATSGNQTINGTKTFRTSPVVPSKTTAATNTGTAIATEAQVYLKADDSNVVHRTGNESISGAKYFDDSNGTMFHSIGNGMLKVTSFSANTDGVKIAAAPIPGNSNYGRPLILQGTGIESNPGGCVGIGVDQPTEKLEVGGNVLASGFKKSGGTSSQFLKADGSVDSTSYATAANLNGKQDKATSGSAAPATTPSYVGQQYIDTTNDKMYVATGTSSSSDWTEVGAGGGDMNYSDFGWQTKTGTTVTLDLASTITPTGNFTVNAPSTIKDGQTYILRVNNEGAAPTMTLGTNVTNPFETDLALTDYGIDQFVFLAIGGVLELQPEGGGGGGGGAITADTTGTTTSINKIWVGTEEEYANLGTYEENVAYMTY